MLYSFIYRHNWPEKNEDASKLVLLAFLLSLFVNKDPPFLQMMMVNCSSQIVSYLLLGPIYK